MHPTVQQKVISKPVEKVTAANRRWVIPMPELMPKDEIKWICKKCGLERSNMKMHVHGKSLNSG